MLGNVRVTLWLVYLECLRAYILIAFQGPRTVEGGKRLETPVGTVFAGRYRVESTLGSGGMAVVYRAEDKILGRAVALKTLHHRYAEMPSFRRCFRQEARAMASLDHENIVKVYDISQDGEVPFMVVECVSGRDLGDLLSGRSGRRSGRLNEQFVRRMAHAASARALLRPQAGHHTQGHQAFQHTPHVGGRRSRSPISASPASSRRTMSRWASPERSSAAPVTCPPSN